MIVGKVTVDLKPMANIKQALQNRIARKAIRRGCALIRDDVKQALPRRTGALKSSIGIKIKTRKNRVTGIVGPRSDYQKKGSKPVRYAGILESGSRYITARNYLKTSFNARKESYLEVVNETIREEVAKL